MPARRSPWLAALTALGLAGPAAAGPPATGPDRLQALVFPAEPGPPGEVAPAAGLAPVAEPLPGPPPGWAGPSIPGSARPRVPPGGHQIEHTGSGIFGPFQYDETDRWLDFGIIIQTEYLNNAPSAGASSEYLFFRRLRPVVMGGFGDWQGVIMMDFGAGQNGNNYQSSVRWADIEYTGFYQAHARFGSFKPWFSAELLTLGPHLLNVERSNLGNTNYGNPDYLLGVGWDQMLPGRRLAYYASVGLEDHAQGVTQMQMRSPAYAPSGSNQGVIATGRVDYMVFGEMVYDARPLHTPSPSVYNRSDFHSPFWRMLVSTAAYGWWNDGTSNPYTVDGASTSTTNADLDRAYGVEVSSGLRGHGFSGNVEYQFVRGDLLARAFTGGLYADGRTNLNKLLVSTGYMLPCDVEPVVAWSAVDATGFRQALTQTTVGVNWYVKKYGVRFAADYSFVNNNNGSPGDNIGVTRALAQFVW